MLLLTATFCCYWGNLWWQHHISTWSLFFAMKTDALQRVRPFNSSCTYWDVLGLSEVELIFFTMASKGLWFGFVLGTVLVISRCVCYSWQSLHRPRAFCCFSVLPHWHGDWAWGAGWEETQPQQVTPSDQRDAPYQLCHALYIKLGDKGRRGDIWGLSPQETIVHNGALLS